MNTDKHG